MERNQLRWNSLSNWTIQRICAEHGITAEWSGDRMYADLPAYWNGKMRLVSIELTNMTKRELLEAIA